MPENCYEVEINKPLGITFEEVDTDDPNSGLYVAAINPKGNAAKCGDINVGDKLIAATGVIIRGARFERRLIQVDNLDYDTIIAAISSNEVRKFKCILQFVKSGFDKPESYLSGKMRSTASPLSPMEIF